VLWRYGSTSGVSAAAAFSSVILRSRELRCVSSPDPVLGEGGAGSEGGDVCCGGMVPPVESVLQRSPPSFFGAASFGACPPLILF
jgi:hypothetical protein